MNLIRLYSDAAGESHFEQVIHDWSEAQCLTILGNCRRAMNPQWSLAYHRDGPSNR
jgi:hypothetical protein